MNLLFQRKKLRSMGKCFVKWEQQEDGTWKWRCSRYWLNQGRAFRESSEVCYHYQCKGRAERVIHSLIEKAVEEVQEPPKTTPICAWYRCDKPVAPNKLRHCSEVCRKRQNRWDYKQRKKKEREDAKRQEKDHNLSD